MQKKIYLPFLLILISCSISVSAEETKAADPPKKISLSFIKQFVIKEELIPQANKIFTVSGSRKNRGASRRPPSNRYKTTWIPVDLVYVAPGGLEPDRKYDFCLDKRLGISYKEGSFSFSGPAWALCGRAYFGWGVENDNGDFIPYLIEKNYEDRKEPYYDISWRIEKEALGADSSVYLNYSIKVPKESHIKWGTELARNSYSFGGHFPTTAPNVSPNKILRFFRSSFQTFATTLRMPDLLSGWKLPTDFKLTGFAFDSEQKIIFAASDDKKICAFDKAGTKKWEVPGSAPVIPYGKFLFALSQDFRSIIILDSATGKITASQQLPRYLPREGCSLGFFSGNKNNAVLILNIPGQSRLFCFKVTEYSCKTAK